MSNDGAAEIPVAAFDDGGGYAMIAAHTYPSGGGYHIIVASLFGGAM